MSCNIEHNTGIIWCVGAKYLCQCNNYMLHGFVFKVEVLWFKCFIFFLENLVLGTFICADNESEIKKKKINVNVLQKATNASFIFLIIMLKSILRVRAFFHKTVRVCHVYCNFKIGFTCRITVIFGTMKDGSLLISTLASNICFSYRNNFQNGVDALSKIVDAFLSKSSKFYLVRIIR